MLHEDNLQEALWLFGLILPHGGSEKEKMFEAALNIKLSEAIPILMKILGDTFIEKQQESEGYFDFVIAAIQYAKGEISQAKLYEKIDYPIEEIQRLAKIRAIQNKKT